MAIQLTVRFPDGSMQTLTVPKEVAFIGRREGNDVILPFPFVSGRHCRVFRHGSRLLVEDLGSTNGTLVNGEGLPPQTPHALRPGDVIQIGTVEIRAQWFEEAAVVVETSAPTVYEAVPAETPPRTSTRPPNPPAAPASVPDAPATMWEIQTGIYRSAVVQVDDHRVGTATANAPVPPQPAFSGLGVARPGPTRRTEPSVDAFQAWSIFFQAIGLVTIFGAIILLIIVLLS